MRFLLLASLSIVTAFPAFAAKVVYDEPAVGSMEEYSAIYEDTLVHVARDHSLGYVEMRAANPEVDPWIPGEGTKLTLPKQHIIPDAPRDGIIINLPEMRLFAFTEAEKSPVTFPIGVGREGLNTPLGDTKVVRKTQGPVWRPTARMREEDPKLPESIGPGPDNPLGDYALYLGWPTYAIHGTNKPFGIGRRVSSGCIRMYPESIEALYEKVPVGMNVHVVNQPIKLAWIDNKLFLEAHPDMAQAFDMEETGRVYEHSLGNDDLKKIWEIAGKHKDLVDWPLVRRLIKERRGYPVKIAEKPETQTVNTDDEKENDQKLAHTQASDLNASETSIPIYNN